MSDPATTVAAAPFVALLQPYLSAAVTALVGAAAPLLAAAFMKWTGIAIKQGAVDQLRHAAEIEAGKAVAAAADNLVSRQIDVHSQIVRDAADAIAARLPSALEAAGVTTDAVQHLVTGEIGKLQARMTVASVAAPAAR